MSFLSSLKPNKPKRTSFDLSHEVKLTTDFGKLVPFFVQDVIPGDTFKVSVETLVRFAPMIAPIMHRVNVYTHFFFVPYRLVWDEWREFITGGEDGTAEPVFPRCHIEKSEGNQTSGIVWPLFIGPSTLTDYMGFPYNFGEVTVMPAMNIDINLLPFRAYQLIYNEYYRDQNLQDEVDFSKSSGIFEAQYMNGRPDVDGCLECLYLRTRCWEKDYFTSALPFPQRLSNPVSVPVNGYVDIEADRRAAIRNPSFYRMINGAPGTGSPLYTNNSGEIYNSSDTNAPLFYDPSGSLVGKFSDNTGVTVNELRRAFSLQRWLENNARAGSRYIEQIFSHFGVRSSDARLQRPEYLGGGKSPVVISEVMQTSETANSPQGNVAGAGVSYGTSHSFKRFFEEHGIVLGILSIMPRSAYQNGIPRLFAKFDKFDYYFPEFAHLGEQEVKQYELYCDSSQPLDASYNNKVFGYLPRYAEYRYVNSHVHGYFRTSMNFWHMGRNLTPNAGLNSEFVTCNHAPLDRIFAVEDEYVDHLWVQMYVKFYALRPLPKYGTPGL
uniref:Major capsid protein n=1 Tax=Dulem virus 99 TaxID=3145810 RepID=A0AAU8AX36_9VIRU